MAKSNKTELSFDKEIGFIDITPKDNPEEEKKRTVQQNNAVRDFLMRTRGIEEIPDEELFDFDE